MYHSSIIRSGPFLSDLSVSIIAIIVAISIIKQQNYFVFKNKYFIIFIIFNLFLIARSIFAYDPIFSLKVTLFILDLHYLVLASHIVSIC